ncbi:MAG: CpsB/CapC family capsule biosynthesis tyrosine phosphatase [Clostridia bacterium]
MFDIHSHVLYGVDDGARTIDESVDMLKKAKMSGIDKIIATPHVRREYGNVNLMRERFLEVRDEADKLGIKLFMGYEVNCLMLTDIKPEDYKSYCIEGTNSFLLEFEFSNIPAYFDTMIYALQKEGLTVIIAHPERYLFVLKDFKIAERLIEMGCEIQIESWSLSLPKFSNQRRVAEKLITEGKAHYIASDAHKSEDYINFAKNIRRYGKTFLAPSLSINI